MTICQKCKRTIERLPCKFCYEPKQLHKAVGFPRDDDPKTISAEHDPKN